MNNLRILKRSMVFFGEYRSGESARLMVKKGHLWYSPVPGTGREPEGVDRPPLMSMDQTETDTR